MDTNNINTKIPGNQMMLIAGLVATGAHCWHMNLEINRGAGCEKTICNSNAAVRRRYDKPNSLFGKALFEINSKAIYLGNTFGDAKK